MNAFVELTLKNVWDGGKISQLPGDYVRFESESSNKAAFDGYHSQTYFGHVVYRLPGDHRERKSPPLMLKNLPAKVVFIRDCSLIQFFNEISFHTRVMPLFQSLGDLQSLLPQFYACQMNLTARSDDILLIFENLGPRQYRTAPKFSFLDVEHLSLMLRKLGNFHGYSYKAKKEKPKEFGALGKWFYDTHDAMGECFPNFYFRTTQRGLERLRKDPLYAPRLANVEKMVENAAQFMSRVNYGERNKRMSVLCHGDYLRGNVMFKYDEGKRGPANGKPCDLKMIDMAACRIASPVIDIGSVLYLNADQTTRSLHWDRLIGSYYEGLGQILEMDDLPAKESVIGEFHSTVFYAYIVASYFVPMTIALDRGTKNLFESFGKEYANCSVEEVPEEIINVAFATVGGDEGTEALADILKDMIDRNFL